MRQVGMLDNPTSPLISRSALGMTPTQLPSLLHQVKEQEIATRTYLTVLATSVSRSKPNCQNLMSWKVYEVSATPIFSKEAKMAKEGAGMMYVLRTETLRKRRLPKNPTNFKEEGILNMKDAIWLLAQSQEG
ncbi:transcription factor bHLH129-like [Iris pallida]|uniref:Transcription factor bHLH129-like n=1 Tax=Iris pallida TaxID=29817 RepID=A0AAX6ERA2_IRIPA|nr:transcription factor bHLH129-like [Iris pallida]